MTTLGPIFPSGFPDRRPPTAAGRPADLEAVARRAMSVGIDWPAVAARYRASLAGLLLADKALMLHASECTDDPCDICDRMTADLEQRQATAVRMIEGDRGWWPA